MGIGVQSEACGEVAQHAADRLDVHTILQSLVKPKITLRW